MNVIYNNLSILIERPHLFRMPSPLWLDELLFSKTPRSPLLLSSPLTKYRVLAVEPLRGGECDEELRPVAVGAWIGHGQDTGSSVLQVIVQLVVELPAVDAGPTTTRARGVTTCPAARGGGDMVGQPKQSKALTDRANNSMLS